MQNLFDIVRNIHPKLHISFGIIYSYKKENPYSWFVFNVSAIKYIKSIALYSQRIKTDKKKENKVAYNNDRTMLKFLSNFLFFFTASLSLYNNKSYKNWPCSFSGIYVCRFTNILACVNSYVFFFICMHCVWQPFVDFTLKNEDMGMQYYYSHSRRKRLHIPTKKFFLF